MFVPFWLIFVTTGLAMSVFTVVWAIRSRQFDDQQRARFIPLAGMTAAELEGKPLRSHRAEYVAVCFMLVMGMLTIVAGFALAMRHM
jgi:nitrogen fixation-related uncharacterized protein